MLIIEIAIGVFLGGMGLWLFVSHRDKKAKTEQGKRQEQLDFDTAEKCVTEQFKALSAECANDLRGQLATSFDDPNRSAIEAAGLAWNRALEHLEEIKKRVAINTREALKESLSMADRTGGRERLEQHVDRLISDSIHSVNNELMLMYVKELQSFNDDDLPSITHGHPRKQFSLGNAHRLGKNVEQDYGKAERLLRLSANQGYTDAEALLGYMYFAGDGVERDNREALKWLRLAAEKSDEIAQNFLGLMFSHGYGVTQNHAEALRWLHLSAAQGFAAAQTNIGTMYYEGDGIEKDMVRANMWFMLAAAKGEPDALNNFMVARRSMSPDQIAESERLALANDETVLQFVLRQSEGILSDPLSIYHEPKLLAEYFTNGYLVPLMTRYKELARPTLSEIEQWSITDFELSRCTEEIALLGAMGTFVTVKNNKSEEYYATFIHALAEHVEKLLSWQEKVGAHDEIIKVIEDYVYYLNSEQMVEFACAFTERVFTGNGNQSAIFAAHFWNRAFAVGLGTMGASRGFFAAFTAEETARNAVT